MNSRIASILDSYLYQGYSKNITVFTGAHAFTGKCHKIDINAGYMEITNIKGGLVMIMFSQINAIRLTDVV